MVSCGKFVFQIDSLHNRSKLREVVEAMLRDVLPEETRDGEIADLIEVVMSDALVERHDGKCWSEVTRGEASAIARVIGRVAADAILDERLSSDGRRPRGTNVRYQ